MKHPLRFVSNYGLLGRALGVTPAETAQIDAIVKDFTISQRSFHEMIQAVGALDISDEAWANFLYTIGYWHANEERKAAVAQ